MIFHSRRKHICSWKLKQAEYSMLDDRCRVLEERNTLWSGDVGTIPEVAGSKYTPSAGSRSSLGGPEQVRTASWLSRCLLPPDLLFL
jgi:hypothetical protein